MAITFTALAFSVNNCKSPFSKGGPLNPPLKKAARGNFSSSGANHVWFVNV